MSIINKKFIFLFSILFTCCFAISAQNNGMFFDKDHTFLSPMLKNNILVGHAMVYKLDNISKDSSSYSIAIYDDNLNQLGEKKVHLEKNFNFEAVVFNGEQFVSKFVSSKNLVRYIVLNQEAGLVFDTTISLKITEPTTFKLWNNKSSVVEYKFSDFQPTPIYAINQVGIIDNIQLYSGSNPKYATVFLSKDNKLLVTQSEGKNGFENAQIIGANKQFFVKANYYSHGNAKFNKYDCVIEINALQGNNVLGELKLNTQENIEIFPIAADIQKGQIEIVSQFTKKKGKYGKIKYGICIHRISENGNLISEKYNELTETLKTDSVAKSTKLIINSFVYFHLAKKLSTGNWLLSAEHLQRTITKIRMSRNNHITFNKSHIAMFEIDAEADVKQLYVEKCKLSGRALPKKFSRSPQMGAFYIKKTNGMDVHYFIENPLQAGDDISYVYLNINSTTKKKTLGNIIYRNGIITSDKYVIPKSEYSYTSIFPTKYRHCLLIKVNPSTGFFDFDNVKFNN